MPDDTRVKLSELDLDIGCGCRQCRARAVMKLAHALEEDLSGDAQHGMALILLIVANFWAVNGMPRHEALARMAEIYDGTVGKHTPAGQGLH